MKKRTSLIVIPAFITIPFLVSAQSLADIFYTGFEASEGYLVDSSSTGSNPTVTGNNQSQIRSGGNDGRPFAPQGTAYAAIGNNNTAAGNIRTAPFESNITSDFYVSLQIAWTGDMNWGGAAPNMRVIFGNTTLSSDFNGISFGMVGDSDNENIYAMVRHGTGNAVVLISDTPLQQDTFYRYEVDVRLEGKNYDIRLYDGMDVLMGGLTNIAFTHSSLTSINMINYTVSAPFFRAFVDDVWVSTMPIPEGAHYSLGLLAVVALFLYRKRRMER